MASVTTVPLTDSAMVLRLPAWYGGSLSHTDSSAHTDRAEAYTEKFTGSWSDVPPADLDEDIDEHLIALPDGRWGWRICVPAMMSYWSELAREVVVPHPGTPVTVVRGALSDPPYVTAALLDALTARLGGEFRCVDFDCKHMVAQARPAQTAELIREMLER